MLGVQDDTSVQVGVFAVQVADPAEQCNVPLLEQLTVVPPALQDAVPFEQLNVPPDVQVGL